MGVGRQGRRVRRRGRRATNGREDERVREKEREGETRRRAGGFSGERRLRVSMGTVYIRPLFREKRGIYPIPTHQVPPPSLQSLHLVLSPFRSPRPAAHFEFFLPGILCRPFPFLFTPFVSLCLSLRISLPVLALATPRLRGISRPRDRDIAVGPLFVESSPAPNLPTSWLFSVTPLTQLILRYVL